MLQAKSLIKGQLVSGEINKENNSPVDGTSYSESNFLNSHQLEEVFKSATSAFPAKTDYSELENLAKYIEDKYSDFTEQIMLDAGFTREDAKDLVDGTIEFCKFYANHINEIVKPDVSSTFTFKGEINQKITLTSSPYGLIAATTPRNTPLITELTIIVHALWSGNSLALRPSPGVAGTVSLLIEALIATFRPETLEKLNIVFADAKEFVATGMEYSNLIHYVGSSKYLETTLIAGIKKGVKVLVDGDGCSMVIVDKTFDVLEAAKICHKGLIRCNGEICITIRAIVVEESIYEEFKKEYIRLMQETRVGIPGNDSNIDMGPLFSTAQAENIKELSKKYSIVYSDKSPEKEGSNYISPCVIELPSNDRSFMKESLFGPMVGITSYKNEEWKSWLTENQINLTDVVLSNDHTFVESFLNTSKSPRRVVNVDPTVESVFEPWGAFLPSGWNDVSYWYLKYRNYFQLVKK